MMRRLFRWAATVFVGVCGDLHLDDDDPPHVAGWPWVCTRYRGHLGEHRAGGDVDDRAVYARW